MSIENHFHWQLAYYAAVEHEPLRVGSSSPREAIDAMGRHRDVTVERLADRRKLLASLDGIRRRLDADAARGVDRFRARATEIIASAKVRNAFD